MGEDERAEVVQLLDDVGWAFARAVVLLPLFVVTVPVLLYRMLGLPGALHARSPLASRLMAVALVLGGATVPVLVVAMWSDVPAGASGLALLPVFAVVAYLFGWWAWCDAVAWRRIGHAWKRSGDRLCVAWALAYGSSHLSSWPRLAAAMGSLAFFALALDLMGRAADSMRTALLPEPEARAAA